MSDSSTLDLVARDIFFITTSKEPLSPSQQPLIYVEDVAASVSGPLSADLLAEAVLERLLLPEPQVFVVPLVNINKIPPEVIQVKLVTYLFESWQRLQEYGNKITYAYKHLIALLELKSFHYFFSPTDKVEVESIIVRNVATGLMQKELHPTQNIPLQILWLLCEQTYDDCSKAPLKVLRKLITNRVI
jgi:hypothetical protein